MPDKPLTPPEVCIARVNSAIDHWLHFAPGAPLERFLAQEIAAAKAEAFDEAGWGLVAKSWYAAVKILGEEPMTTRLAKAPRRD